MTTLGQYLYEQLYCETRGDLSEALSGFVLDALYPDEWPHRHSEGSVNDAMMLLLDNLPDYDEAKVEQYIKEWNEQDD